MKLSAQPLHLYELERLAVKRKEYNPFTCQRPYALFPQPVQQVISLTCHRFTFLPFYILLFNIIRLHRLAVPHDKQLRLTVLSQ